MFKLISLLKFLDKTKPIIVQVGCRFCVWGTRRLESEAAKCLLPACMLRKQQLPKKKTTQHWFSHTSKKQRHRHHYEKLPGLSWSSCYLFPEFLRLCAFIHIPTEACVVENLNTAVWCFIPGSLVSMSFAFQENILNDKRTSSVSQGRTHSLTLVPVQKL